MNYSNAVQSLWTGSCIILEESSVANADNKRTVKHYIPIMKGVKCRVSYGQSSATSGNPAEVSQGIILFISNDITIKPGSRMQVTQNGVTTDYKAAGNSRVYSTHQEVELIREEKA